MHNLMRILFFFGGAGAPAPPFQRHRGLSQRATGDSGPTRAFHQRYQGRGPWPIGINLRLWSLREGLLQLEGFGIRGEILEHHFQVLLGTAPILAKDFKLGQQ
jgi:hypothetical protein